MFESLKARLDRLFVEHAADPRARAAALRDAAAETKAAVVALRDALAATERELEHERRQLADAERRGRLAGEIGDAETVAVAERFVARHGERVGMLERKLGVQRDELAMAQRDLEEVAARLRDGGAAAASSASTEAAWRDIEAAGGTRPGATDLESDLLRARSDRQRMEAAAEAQLAAIKKKLGKDR